MNVVGLGGTARTAAAQTEEEIEAQEIVGVGTVKVGLAEAIAAAEKQLGGKVVAGGLEVDAGRLVYELLVNKDGGLTGVQVDPARGAVGPAGEAGGGSGQALLPPEDAKIDLGQAVHLTETASGNKALEAGLEQQHGVVVYVVEIVDGEVSVHRVDPVSGAISEGKN